MYGILAIKFYNAGYAAAVAFLFIGGSVCEVNFKHFVINLLRCCIRKTKKKLYCIFLVRNKLLD